MARICCSSTARVAVLSTLLAASPAFAEFDSTNHQPADNGDYYAYADVVAVSPRYARHEVTEPVRQCVDVVDTDGTPYGWHRVGYRGSPQYYRRSRHRGYEHDRGDGVAAGLVGGIIGGLIGHQFGGGDGKTALTIVGAALGASIARGHVGRAAHEGVPSRAGTVRYFRPYRRVASHRYTSTVRRCTESERTRQVRGVIGYDVTYRYQGATLHKWVDEYPGDAIRVHVDVEPLLTE